MLPSKKLLSLPIISLKEGQKIGYVKNIIINPKTIAVAALVVDPKRFFMEQRIIPYNRVVNIGENAITVGTESQVEKAANLPDIMHLLKEKTAVIGMKVITANGKSLGIVDEFYINQEDGSIEFIDISGGKIEGLFHGKARLKAEEIITLGSEVMVVSEDSEDKLENCIKGINDNIKSFIRLASNKIMDQGEKINNSRKNKNKKVFSEQKTDEYLQESSLTDTINLDQEDNREKADAQQENKPEETKNEPA
ncbi:MAG: photosystem reaction center subunit H [Peptococcaceae bacterium]|nr:photosystem reaction center subunit H [Peptococcaceae bacterium]